MSLTLIENVAAVSEGDEGSGEGGIPIIEVLAGPEAEDVEGLGEGGWGIGWGEDPWGDPPIEPELQFVGATVPDDGGIELVISGNFADQIHRVLINDTACYSGVSGNGFDVVPEDGLSLIRFVVPGGLPVDDHDLEIQWGGNSTVLADAIHVVRRNRRIQTYHYARLFPRGPWSGRGPTAMRRGTILD